VWYPGSLTLPLGVGFLFFAATPQKTETLPEWVGTHLRAFFAVRKQSPPQVTPVEGAQPSMGVTCGCVREPGSLTLPILVGLVVFFDFVEKTTNPTTKLWHALACVFCRAQVAHKTGDTC
jgi:hypothetical protein